MGATRTVPNTIAKYSESAAKRFIQTAVIIDDRLFAEIANKNDQEIKKLSNPNPVAKRKSSGKAKTENESKAISESEPENKSRMEESPFDLNGIVHSFAKMNIVCSLYQPHKNEDYSSSSTIYEICKASDIAIIDWNLHENSGTDTLELISELIKQAVEDEPEQLRLVLVYTQEMNPDSILDEIHSRIISKIRNADKVHKSPEQRAIFSENSRVVILSKQTGRFEFAGKIHKNFVVTDKDLATKAVKEFTKLADGILHAASLLCLALIRTNSRKILSRFNSDLDPGFLIHYAMSLHKEDTSDHVIQMIISEIRSVLKDELSLNLFSEKLLLNWCENEWDPATHADDIAKKLQPEITAKEYGKEIIKNGLKANKNKQIIERAKIFFQKEDDHVNHKFSHLMSCRTYYDKTKRFLTMGTIILDVDEYLLCVQPVCDTVRINTSRTFLFAQFERSDSESGEKLSHVVFNAKNEPVELMYNPKSFKCKVIEFAADPKFKRVVANEEDGAYFFQGIDESNYKWLGELKPAHAQRCVEKFSTDLSRVGLIESEWLRRLERDD